MLVIHAKVLDETNGKVLAEGEWKPAPSQDAGDLSKALARVHGRNTGALTADVDQRLITAGYKFDKAMRTEEGNYIRVAICRVGWKEGKGPILAYDMKRRMPLPGVEADKLDLVIPRTGYPGGRSLPSSAVPGAARRKGGKINRVDLIGELVSLQKRQTEIMVDLLEREGD